MPWATGWSRKADKQAHDSQQADGKIRLYPAVSKENDNNGGFTHNLKFSKSIFNGQREKVASLLDTYFAIGGASVMITCVGKEDLQNAKERPEEYRNLMVRVGGFSARFETYTPYIEALSQYIRKYCPHSKLLIHQTWAYEDGSAKLTLVNVWATYCQPCLAEMPYLGELAAEYADKGVQIVGIPIDVFDSAGNVDADQIELAKRYVASTGANYLHLIPDGEMQSNLLREVYYVPNSWFLDSEGKLIGEAVVGSYSKEDWAGMIEEHLALVQD